MLQDLTKYHESAINKHQASPCEDLQHIKQGKLLRSIIRIGPFVVRTTHVDWGSPSREWPASSSFLQGRCCYLSDACVATVGVPSALLQSGSGHLLRPIAHTLITARKATSFLSFLCFPPLALLLSVCRALEGRMCPMKCQYLTTLCWLKHGVRQ